LLRFRWVFCQLEVLRHCFPANLRQTLEELPKSLDETYKRILNEINNANQVHAYRLLQCLVVALRPLRVEELAEVLAFDLTAGGIPKFNANWRWDDQEEVVLSACSSLVSIIMDGGDRIVQFSHFSVKEFLTSNRLANCVEEVSQFHIPIEPSHVILAQACLGVLLCLDDGTDQDSVKSPLYDYSARYWDKYAQIGNVESQIKDAMDHFFDLDSPHFSAFLRCENLFQNYGILISRDVPYPAAPLCLAARRGLHGLVERLITKHPQQVNQVGSGYGTPLHASVHGGHLRTCRILLKHNAEVDSRNHDGFTPLLYALLYAPVGRQLDIVRLLLDYNADVHAYNNQGNTPLHLSAIFGHLEICRILLEHKAEVDSLNNDGSTPFLLSLERESFDVAWILLDHNPDVLKRDKYGKTALHVAARNGLLHIARRLLERDADVNSRNHRGSNPLLTALRHGYPDMAQLLLDHNADVYLHDVDGDTPLHFAVLGGFLEVVRILLRLNVEVNSRNNEGSTPLHYVTSSNWKEGYPDIVRLLLCCGADVQVRGRSGKTALERACNSEQWDIVLLLSEHAAE
jgi:ankyrin repeat protein